MASMSSSSKALRDATQTVDARKIGLREAVGFGIGDFYGGGQLTLAATYLSLFWTRFCGLGIGAAQTVIGMSAIISAVAALLFGVFDDNLYRFRVGRRFGRRRLLLLVTSPLLLTGIFLWLPGMPLAVYFLAYTMWVVLVQLFATGYNPLPGEMTKDFNGRTMLSTVRLSISTAAGTLIPLAGSAVLAVFGDTNPSGYMTLGITTTVLFSCAVFICWHSTWEMTPEQAGFGSYVRDEVRTSQAGLKEWIRRAKRVLREYLSTLRIGEFRRHLSIYLLVQMSMDVFGQTFIFYVVYDWNKTAAFASLLIGCTAVSLPLMPVFGWAMTKIGPRRLYSINFAGCIIGAGWLLSSWLLADAMPSPAWIAFAVAGALWFFVFKALCGYMPWAVFPYIADIDQIVTKRYRSATFSGIQACMRQICSGVATMAVGVVPGAVGFDSTLRHQSSAAQIGLAAVLLGWFAFAMSICWLVSTRLTISKETDAIVLREITRLRNGGPKADIDPAARTVIERLTGVPHERCWS